MKIIIETERLYLREMNMNDFDAFNKILGDQENMKYYPYIFEEERVRNWIIRNVNRYKEYGFGLWAVCLKNSDEVIGDTGLTMQNIDEELLPEIGYHIRRDLHHQGYAKEATTAVRDWAFKNTSFTSLYSYCTADNIPSYKTAESIGMTFHKEYIDKSDGALVHVSIIHKK